MVPEILYGPNTDLHLFLWGDLRFYLSLLKCCNAPHLYIRERVKRYTYSAALVFGFYDIFYM